MLSDADLASDAVMRGSYPPLPWLFSRMAPEDSTRGIEKKHDGAWEEVDDDNDDDRRRSIISPLEWHAEIFAYWQLCNQMRARKTDVEGRFLLNRRNR